MSGLLGSADNAGWLTLSYFVWCYLWFCVFVCFMINALWVEFLFYKVRPFLPKGLLGSTLETAEALGFERVGLKLRLTCLVDVVLWLSTVISWA
jgi:hypothetical protein